MNIQNYENFIIRKIVNNEIDDILNFLKINLNQR